MGSGGRPERLESCFRGGFFSFLFFSSLFFSFFAFPYKICEMAARSKRIVGGIVVAIVGVVGYTHLYLPFYSKVGRERREQVATGTLPKREHVEGPGSMWQNISESAEAKVRVDLCECLSCSCCCG